jgi:hypothetical protein
MASEMIERAARALASNAGILNWDAAFDREQENFRAHARVVIQAMRDPTDEMLVEMEDAAHCFSCFKPREESPSYIAWQAAIASALSEQDR